MRMRSISKLYPLSFHAFLASSVHRLPLCQANSHTLRECVSQFDFLACVHTFHLRSLVPFGGREIREAQSFPFAFALPAILVLCLNHSGVRFFPLPSDSSSLYISRPRCCLLVLPFLHRILGCLGFFLRIVILLPPMC